MSLASFVLRSARTFSNTASISGLGCDGHEIAELGKAVRAMIARREYDEEADGMAAGSSNCLLKDASCWDTGGNQNVG